VSVTIMATAVFTSCDDWWPENKFTIKNNTWTWVQCYSYSYYFGI